MAEHNSARSKRAASNLGESSSAATPPSKPSRRSGGGHGVNFNSSVLAGRMHEVLDSLRGGHLFQFGRVDMRGVMPCIGIKHDPKSLPSTSGRPSTSSTASPGSTFLRFPLSGAECDLLQRQGVPVALATLSDSRHRSMRHRPTKRRRRRGPDSGSPVCYVVEASKLAVSSDWVKAVIQPVAQSVAEAMLGVAARDTTFRVVPAALIALGSFAGSPATLHSAGRSLHPCLAPSGIAAAAEIAWGSNEFRLAGTPASDYSTFATVDVVLPSYYTGGEALVHSSGTSTTIPSVDTAHEFSYVAFHALSKLYCREIHDGCRVVLRCVVQARASAPTRFRPSTRTSVCPLCVGGFGRAWGRARAHGCVVWHGYGVLAWQILALSNLVHTWVGTPGAIPTIAYVFEHQYPRRRCGRKVLQDNDKVRRLRRRACARPWVVCLTHAVATDRV